MALLKLALLFVGIVILLTRKWNLGLVLVVASLAIGPLFSYSLIDVASDIYLASRDYLTLRLALIVILIMVLGELLRQTEGLSQTVKALENLIPNGRIVIAAMPALVGLLPMVGGAMFSAPMVDEVGERLGVDRSRRTFVNYWFRHIWEPIFPLYPSMILAAGLLEISPSHLIRATWPITVAAIAGGFLFGLLGLSRRSDETMSDNSRKEDLRLLVSSIWPVLLVVVLSLILNIDERFDMLISLVATIGLTMALKRVPVDVLWDIFIHRVPWETVVVIFGAMIFRRVLEESGAVVAVSQALTAMNVPLVVVVFVVPFIPGLLTGLVAAAYSVGFPVVLPMLLAGDQSLTLGWIVWLVAGGITGVMCSPMHLCLALTRAYFKASWGAVYRFIVPSALLSFGLSLAAFLLRR